MLPAFPETARGARSGPRTWLSPGAPGRNWDCDRSGVGVLDAAQTEGQRPHGDGVRVEVALCSSVPFPRPQSRFLGDMPKAWGFVGFGVGWLLCSSEDECC